MARTTETWLAELEQTNPALCAYLLDLEFTEDHWNTLEPEEQAAIEENAEEFGLMTQGLTVSRERLLEIFPYLPVEVRRELE